MTEEIELPTVTGRIENASKHPSGAIETLEFAVTYVNAQLDKAVRLVKVTKWKFVSLGLSLTLLQLLQVILVQTVRFSKEESRWLFTGFSIITIGFKLLEELWPFRKHYKAVKSDVSPFWESKHKIDYSHMASAAGGQVINIEDILVQILPPTLYA